MSHSLKSPVKLDLVRCMKVEEKQPEKHLRCSVELGLSAGE